MIVYYRYSTSELVIDTIYIYIYRVCHPVFILLLVIIQYVLQKCFFAIGILHFYIFIGTICYDEITSLLFGLMRFEEF